MNFSKCTETDVRAAVEKANEEQGYELEFVPAVSSKETRPVGRIVPLTSDSHGSRRSASGRRVKAASWEAHRDVMVNLFERCPKATIRTSIITYKGKEDFQAKFRATADHNVGSQVYPAYIRDLSN